MRLLFKYIYIFWPVLKSIQLKYALITASRTGKIFKTHILLNYVDFLSGSYHIVYVCRLLVSYITETDKQHIFCT